MGVYVMGGNIKVHGNDKARVFLRKMAWLSMQPCCRVELMLDPLLGR